MSRRPRILFVCFADSTHSQSWMSLLKNTEFEVRAFASPVDYNGFYPPCAWQFPTYTLNQARLNGEADSNLFSIPRIKFLSLFFRILERQMSLAVWRLHSVIQTWKPDVLHTLRLNPEAHLTWKSLKSIPSQHRPKWILSSWGRELDIEVDDPKVRAQLHVVFDHCDGFIADCDRDLRRALSLGLSEGKLPYRNAFPTAGGVDLDYFAAIRNQNNARNLIVIPKAFEGYNKTLSVLEAMSTLDEALNGYEVHLLACSAAVRKRLDQMPLSFKKRCHLYSVLPQEEFFEKLVRARVMIAPSLSDGTPNVMLEAMAAGALPLMSPLESIQEWIEDGHNGLLAPALEPEKIAQVLKRALTDDALFNRAQSINWNLVEQHANRSAIRQQVLNFYRQLVNPFEPSIVASYA